MTRSLLALSMLLGLCGTVFGANAHWGEEMNALPADSGWIAFDGDWMNTVTVGPGGTWRGEEASGFARTTDPGPLYNVGTYTMEYKVRLIGELIQPSPVPPGQINVPITVYNGGRDTARSRTFYGFFGSDVPQWIQDYPTKDVRAEYYMPGDEWQVCRVVMDQAADTHKLFVNGVELISNPGGASTFPDTDDPWLALGAGGPMQPVEYDYIRIYKGALSISEPLNAVPEPSALGLMGLGALGLLLRRRRR